MFRRVVLPLVLVMVLPVGAQEPEPIVPVETPVLRAFPSEPGLAYGCVTSTTAGRWCVLDANGAVESQVSEDGLSVGWEGKSGTYQVVFFSQADAQASAIVETVVLGPIEPTPPIPPDPPDPPDPPPSESMAWLVIIEDRATDSPETRQVVTSTELTEYLADRDVAKFFKDKDAKTDDKPNETVAKYVKRLDAAGIDLPAFLAVGESGKVLLEAELPDNTAELIEALEGVK